MRTVADRGSVTAELAVALPAVAGVLAVAVWGVQLAAVQVRLQDAAAMTARALARGGQPPAPPAGAALSTWTSGDLVCAGVAQSGVEASSCALREDG